MNHEQLADLATVRRLERELAAEAERTDLDPVARQSVEYHLKVARDCIAAMEGQA